MVVIDLISKYQSAHMILCSVVRLDVVGHNGNKLTF